MSLIPKISVVKKHGDTFERLAYEVFASVAHDNVLRMLFFTAIADNNDFLEKQAVIKKLATHFFGNKTPITSIISQTPFACSLAVEIHTINADLEFKQNADLSYITAQKDNQKALFALVSPNKAAVCSSIAQQAERAFGLLNAILEKENISVGNILRQWNYVERITDIDISGQHYQQFNDARSRFYASCLWQNGYPAATGIGTLHGGLTIDLNAYDNIHTMPIDNPLQTAAHRYSDKVLEAGTQEQLTTPKFERARIVGETLYISGTAAIRGEQTIADNAQEQTRITIENIQALLRKCHNKQLTYLRVYIKNEADFSVVKRTINRLLPNTETLFVQADICRPNLLVEIEAVAE